LDTGGDSPEIVVAQMLMAGVDFELLEPGELAPHMLRFAAMLEHAARSADGVAARAR
jgi:hypothetical protein